MEERIFRCNDENNDIDDVHIQLLYFLMVIVDQLNHVTKMSLSAVDYAEKELKIMRM